METVIIVIHLMVIVALIAVVLLQRSEGGALGVGGSNQFMTTRGQGNILTRVTTILAAAFFVTSMAMTILGRISAPPSSILDTVTNPPAAPTTAAPATPGTPAAPGAGGILDELNRFTGGQAAPAPATPPAPGTPAQPQVPTTQ